MFTTQEKSTDTSEEQWNSIRWKIRHLKIKEVPWTTYKWHLTFLQASSHHPYPRIQTPTPNQFTWKVQVLGRDFKKERFPSLEESDKFKGPNTEITKGGLFLADVEILSSDLKENSAFSRDLFCKEDQIGILCGPGRWWGSGERVQERTFGLHFCGIWQEAFFWQKWTPLKTRLVSD